MTWARRALGSIAVVWLVSQAATLALVPALVDASFAECVCTHGTGAVCPMHHTTTAGLRVCVLQNASTSVPAIMNSLFSVVGLSPVPPLAIVPVPTAAPTFLEYSTAIARPAPPDPPPPRA